MTGILNHLVDWGEKRGHPAFAEQARRLLRSHCRPGLWRGAIHSVGRYGPSEELHSRLSGSAKREILLDRWSQSISAFLNRLRLPSLPDAAAGLPFVQLERFLNQALGYFDPESAVGVGLDPVGVAWLTLDGILPDGTRLLLEGEGKTLSATFTQACGTPWPEACEIEAPADWSQQVLRSDNRLCVVFSSDLRGWREPDQARLLLESLKTGLRRLFAGQQLDCPLCSQPMEKIVRDLVLDRCRSCAGAWFDYREREWLLKNVKHLEFLDPPCSKGTCPRCRLPLSKGWRELKCSSCDGAWVNLRDSAHL